MELKLLSVIIWLFVVAAAVVAVVMLVVRNRTLPSERRQKSKPYIVAIAACAAAAALVWGGEVIYRKTIKPAAMGNPFLTSWGNWGTPFELPPFENIRPEHFKPAFEEGMRRQRAEIDSITANPATPTFDNVILAYDRSGELYSTVSRIFSGLTSAETNDKLEAVKAEMSPLQSAHADAIGMDSLLFAKVKSVYDRRAELRLDAAQMRLTERIYKRFERSGALLSPADKAQLQQINGELSSLGVRFAGNRRGAMNAFRLEIDSRDGTGLPSGVLSRARALAREEKLEDKLVFTLSKPSWLPFLTYSDKDDLRRRIYEAYLNQGAAETEFDNTQIINDMIRLRTRKAKLLGFETFADYVLDERMAKTPGQVYEFLDSLWRPSLEKAVEERDAMLTLKRSEKRDTTVMLNSWDWWYYAEKVRKNRYNFDEEQARPYFSLENVQLGIFKLCNHLYGISFRPITVPVYHKDVVVYEVMDIDNTHLGVIYMDFFPRPGKKSGAWCTSYRVQGYTPEGEKIHPVTTIVCNFTEPLSGGSTPSLLTLDEVETFFHEFGHALHNLFADVPYEGLLGVERDFVELPSQIMENWAFEPRMLAEYAIHYRTGDPIPDRTIQRMESSAKFNQGFMTTELLAASYSDMDIHTMTEYSPFIVADFEKYALSTKRGLIPEIEPRYRYPYFGHIFDGGYAAGYYGYIWAEVLDKDAYEAFVESGDIFSRDVANDFRHKVLAPRGMKDGMELYRDFRGSEPGREALLKGRGLYKEPDISPDSLIAMRRRQREQAPRTTPPDSVLRKILNEGPLEE